MATRVPIVVKLPLDGLTTPLGRAERCRDMAAEDIRALLKIGSVRFVVAEVGVPIQWIADAECFEFWKREVRLRIGDPAGSSLRDFPGEYCYFASEWTDGGMPLVLLEKSH